MEILKEKVTFYDKLIQLQIYDINKSFLNSALSKTYFQISNSIIFILEYNSSSCLENFLNLFEKLKDEGVSKKISLIIWKENSIFKGDLNFLLDDKSKKRDSSENHSIISTLNLINANSMISNMTELASTLDTNTSKQKLKFDSNKNSLLNLQIKFKTICKIYKIICIYISTISEISTDNEIFRNFIGYLLLKKFNTPDTSKFQIKEVKKRSSYNLGSSENIIKTGIKNKKKKTSNENKNDDDIRIERMINSHRKTSQF